MFLALFAVIGCTVFCFADCFIDCCVNSDFEDGSISHGWMHLQFGEKVLICIGTLAIEFEWRAIYVTLYATRLAFFGLGSLLLTFHFLSFCVRLPIMDYFPLFYLALFVLTFMFDIDGGCWRVRYCLSLGKTFWLVAFLVRTIFLLVLGAQPDLMLAPRVLLPRLWKMRARLSGPSRFGMIAIVVGETNKRDGEVGIDVVRHWRHCSYLTCPDGLFEKLD